MAASTNKVLSEALKLPADERVRIAEKLLQSADADGFEEHNDAAIQSAWADEVGRRSRELADGSVRGLTVEEARRIVAERRASTGRRLGTFG